MPHKPPDVVAIGLKTANGSWNGCMGELVRQVHNNVNFEYIYIYIAIPVVLCNRKLIYACHLPRLGKSPINTKPLISRFPSFLITLECLCRLQFNVQRYTN